MTTEARPGNTAAEDKTWSEHPARASGDAGRSTHEDGESTAYNVQGTGLLELGSVLLKRWKVITGIPLAVAVVAAIISLLTPPKFTATLTFVPEADNRSISLPPGLAGIASQIGVGVGGGANSPQFYADVLKSRTVMDSLLQTRFPHIRAGVNDSVPLLDILDIKGDNKAARLEAGRKRLDRATTVRVDNQTDIVSISVETRYAALSADVANLAIELLNRFNLETRRLNARGRRRFVEQRVRDTESELKDAEEDLKLFLEQNRQFDGSPELMFQYERLQRQVAIKQEVYVSLRRSYEEARIQEVNDTPLITVIDRAVPPEKKSSPQRRLNVILAFLVGGLLAISGVFGQEYIERARETEQEAFREFVYRWKRVKTELRSVMARRRPPDKVD